MKAVSDVLSRINRFAMSEGWALFPSMNGDMRIYRTGANSKFETDFEAMQHVLSRSEAGSTIHRSAIDLTKAGR